MALDSKRAGCLAKQAEGHDHDHDNDHDALMSMEVILTEVDDDDAEDDDVHTACDHTACDHTVTDTSPQAIHDAKKMATGGRARPAHDTGRQGHAKPVAHRIRELNELLALQLITQAEYDTQRAVIIARVQFNQFNLYLVRDLVYTWYGTRRRFIDGASGPMTRQNASTCTPSTLLARTRGVTGASLSFDLGSAEPRLASYLFLYVFSVL